jgi:hypothetical protein
MAPVFHPNPGIGSAVRHRFGYGSDPVGKFLFTNRNRAGSTIPNGTWRIPKRSAPKKKDWKAVEVVHPDAAGIDVGGSDHWVAVSPDQDPEPVRRFGCFTADLREWADGPFRKACEA